MDYFTVFIGSHSFYFNKEIISIIFGYFRGFIDLNIDSIELEKNLLEPFRNLSSIDKGITPQVLDLPTLKLAEFLDLNMKYFRLLLTVEVDDEVIDYIYSIDKLKEISNHISYKRFLIVNIRRYSKVTPEHLKYYPFNL